jgi:hypothetical protein
MALLLEYGTTTRSYSHLGVMQIISLERQNLPRLKSAEHIRRELEGEIIVKLIFEDILTTS